MYLMYDYSDKKLYVDWVKWVWVLRILFSIIRAEVSLFFDSDLGLRFYGVDLFCFSSDLFLYLFYSRI